MPALTGIDDAVDKCSGGNNGNPQPFFLYKHDLLDAGAAPGGASGVNWQSVWQLVGVPSHGIAPGAAAIPTRATAGALGQANATGGRTLNLCFFGAMAQNSAGPLFVYDRIGHMSGLSGTSVVAQAVGVTAGRYTGAESVGNEMWVEIYQPIGATGRTIIANYTNDANLPAVSPAVVIGGVGFQESQRLIRLPLASGDSGVRSVETVTILGGSTGTAGDFGVTLMRTLGICQTNAIRQPQQRNLLGPDFPPIPVKDDACIAFYWGGTAIAEGPAELLFLEF